MARAIDAAWSTNVRLGHQWDPSRVTDMLPRWERIMQVPVLPSATFPERRLALTKQWQRFGSLINIGRLSARLSGLLGEVFVSLEFIDSSVATIHVPDGSYPWGTASTTNPWYSTTMHMLIRTEVPDGYSEQDYLGIVGQVFPVLDGTLPAWMTWSVYRPGPVSYPVTGGPTAGGFFLNTPHNLNWQVLGT